MSRSYKNYYSDNDNEIFGDVSITPLPFSMNEKDHLENDLENFKEDLPMNGINNGHRERCK